MRIKDHRLAQRGMNTNRSGSMQDNVADLQGTHGLGVDCARSGLAVSQGQEIQLQKPLLGQFDQTTHAKIAETWPELANKIAHSPKDKLIDVLNSEPFYVFSVLLYDAPEILAESILNGAKKSGMDYLTSNEEEKICQIVGAASSLAAKPGQLSYQRWEAPIIKILEFYHHNASDDCTSQLISSKSWIVSTRGFLTPKIQSFVTGSMFRAKKAADLRREQKLTRARGKPI